MADTITEFINVSGKTLAELQAGVPIVVNAANEQAVVKDVVIACTKNRMLTLGVGGNTVATVTGSANLTGTELVGAGTQLNLTTAITALLNTCYATNGSNAFFKNVFDTLFTGDAGTVAGVAYPQSTAVANFTVTPNFMCFVPNGDFYYALHSDTDMALYKRAGGVTGAQTSYANFGHSVCYDGARYLYGFDSGGNIKTLDTQTGAVTSAVLSGMAQNASASYTHACAIDGWVWVHPQYNSGGYLVNPATGQAYAFAGYNSGSAQRYFVAVNKDRAGNYVFVQTSHSSPSISYWSPGKILGANPAVAFSGTLTPGFSSYSGQANRLFRIPGVDNLIFCITVGTVQVFDLTARAIIAGMTLSGGSGDTYATLYGLDSAKAIADFGTVGVRATGIKVTP